ncbi:MAG: hypothetical protein GTN93_00640, partial [Anaerolineae bacterium]|nr:hypothetical protein [Anaerolineae bacterium]
ADWERIALTFAQPTDNTCAPTATFHTIPLNAAEMEIKLKAASGNTACVDAVMLENSYEATDFDPLDPNNTIEYETSREGFWVPDPSG